MSGKVRVTRSLSREVLSLTQEGAVSETDLRIADLLDHEYFNEGDKAKEKSRFEKEIYGFQSLFRAYLEKRHDKIQWDKIKPPAASVIKPYKSIEKPSPERCSQLANKLAVLKLNGGLGTTMGCVGPKSVIEVTDGQTFLDISVKQIQYLNSANKASVPLVLMNSFNTHKDTLNVLKKYKYGSVVIHTFNQSRYPRVWKESLIPVPTSPDSAKQEWYPPGHGDVYESLYNSGLLEQLIEEGKEYLFLSNVDNLGATVDFNILSHMEATGAEFLMEVTDKTRSDVKGGTLIEYNDKLMLLEIAQVPANNVEEFKSIKKFKIFNTNNLWINLKAVKRIIESKGLKDMPVIENNKSFAGKPVIQLERAAGAAIQFFKGGVGVNVPRTRFLPVKSTSDLLVVQSNLFQLKSGKLVNNPARPFPGPPFVKLGAEFKKVSEYNRRIKGRHPNLLELDQLTIAGDVCIGSDVTLKGTVIVVANHGSHIDIPSGSVLENKVVTGNLRILDH